MKPKTMVTIFFSSTNNYYSSCLKDRFLMNNVLIQNRRKAWNKCKCFFLSDIFWPFNWRKIPIGLFIIEYPIRKEFVHRKRPVESLCVKQYFFHMANTKSYRSNMNLTHIQLIIKSWQFRHSALLFSTNLFL